MVVTMLQMGNSVLAQTFGLETLGFVTLAVTLLLLYARYSKGYEAIDKKFAGREKLNTIAMGVVMATTLIIGPGLVTGMAGQAVAIVTGLGTMMYTGFFIAFVVEEIIATTSGFLSK